MMYIIKNLLFANFIASTSTQSTLKLTNTDFLKAEYDIFNNPFSNSIKNGNLICNFDLKEKFGLHLIFKPEESILSFKNTSYFSLSVSENLENIFFAFKDFFVAKLRECKFLMNSKSILSISHFDSLQNYKIKTKGACLIRIYNNDKLEFANTSTESVIDINLCGDLKILKKKNTLIFQFIKCQSIEYKDLVLQKENNVKGSTFNYQLVIDNTDKTIVDFF